MTRALKEVTAHYPWALDAAREAELEDPEGFALFYLALVHVESKGRVTAHRAGSPYWGPAQVYDGYAFDAADEAGVPRFAARELHGDGRLSAWVTAHTLRKYERWHGWDWRHAAVTHKGGPVFSREVRRELEKGRTLDGAVSYVARTLRRRSGRLIASRAPIYLDRWDRAYHVYAMWVDNEAVARSRARAAKIGAAALDIGAALIPLPLRNLEVPHALALDFDLFDDADAA